MVFETAEAARPRNRLAAHLYNADGTPSDPDAEIIGVEDAAPVDPPAPVAPVQPAEPPAVPVAAPAAAGPVQAAVAEAAAADKPAV